MKLLILSSLEGTILKKFSSSEEMEKYIQSLFEESGTEIDWFLVRI